MKKLFLPLFCAIFIFTTLKTKSQNVGINSTGAAPDGSAMLDVSSTASGVLIPRMTQSQRNAIGAPATSLLIYQTDNTPGYYYYDGTAWVMLGGSDNDWDRDNTNGYLYPSTISDRVAIGLNTPVAMLHVKGGPNSSTSQTTTKTVELTNFASDGDTDSQTMALPAGITNATVDIDVTGDMGSSTEYVNVFIDGSQIGGNLSDGADDCVYDQVVTGNNVTTLLQGKASVTLSGNSSTATDVGFDCPSTAVKVRYTFTITYTATINRNAVFESTIGVGTTTPAANLHVSGTFRLEDGTQSNGKVLTTDNNGNASWQNPSSLNMDDGDWTSGTGTSGEPVLYNITDSVGIGTANPDHLFDVDNGSASGTEIGIGSIEYFTDEASETTINNRFSPATDGGEDLGGSTQRWGEVFAMIGTINTSDERDKKNIQELGYGLNEIMKLKPVSYEWREETVAKDQVGKRKLGLIAQEVKPILNEVVKTHDLVKVSEDPLTKEIKEMRRWGIYYSDIIPVLIKGIQEQQAIIEEQDKKYEALKKEIEDLKKQINNK